MAYVVEVAFAGLDEQHLEVVVEIGKSTCDYTATTATSTHDDIEFLWERRHIEEIFVSQYLEGRPSETRRG